MSVLRIATAVLRRVLPAAHRAVVLTHLDLEFNERSARDGVRAARRWYVRQAIASLPAALRLRTSGQVGRTVADVRQAFRWLRRHPAFVAGVTCTLALGVGAANAVATLGAAVLLRPLPYHEAEQLVALQELDREGSTRSGNLSWPDFVDFREQASSLNGIAGYTGGSRTLHREGIPPERLSVTFVTGQFFSVLGVAPLMGRTIDDRDGVTTAPQVAVLTFETWQSRFGGDAAILTRTVTLNEQRIPIVGVLPEKFEFLLRGGTDLYLPERPTQAQVERRYFHWLDVVARLAPGVTVEQAAADIDRIAGSFPSLDPNHRNSAVLVTGLRDRLVGEAKPVLVVLSSAAALVLLVACANLAGLLVSKGVARGGEMAVRQALGAGRTQLVRQLMVETFVIGLPGTAAGLTIGQLVVGGFADVLPRTSRMTMPYLETVGLDFTSIAITLTAVFGTLAVFGIYPAWRTAAMVGRGSAGHGRKDGRIQRVLIAAQTALAATLVAGAALMTQSVVRLLDLAVGFEPGAVLSLELNVSGARYQSPGARDQFFDEVTAQLRQMPGVEGVTAINQSPLDGSGNSGEFTIVGDPSRRSHRTLVRTARSDYFDVLRIPHEAGRLFADADRATAPPVVVISRALADAAFSGQAIGQRVTFPWSGPEPLEVVGVVGDIQFAAVDQPMQPAMYLAASQYSPGNMDVLVKASGDPAALIPAARERLRQIDPAIPAYNVATLTDRIAASESVSRRRTVMVILQAFAFSTLALSAIGIYGLLSQVVGQRTREIGVRMALGATARHVAAAVVRPAAVAAAIGVAAGVAGALAIGRLLRSLLFGIAAADLPTLVGVTVVCLAVSAAACLVPVRRARRVDPVSALRSES